MSTVPVVSVAMCTHNGARFIEEQVRSILSQSRPPDELVISDDASTDQTVERARAVWQRAHDDGCATELKVIAQERALGVTANFEAAIRATVGDVVFLCDQDDVWHEDKVRAQLRSFASPGVLLVFSDARLTGESGEPIGTSLFEALEIQPDDLGRIAGGDGFAVLLRRNLVTGATVAFRRELLPMADPFSPEWLHDEWLAILAAASGAVVPLAEQLIDYRQHGANQVGARTLTLHDKIRRVLEPRGTRTAGLERRATALADRLAAVGADPQLVELGRQKADFERARAALPPARLARIAPVARLARAHLYSRFASRGRMDVLRDLVQPAGPTR